MPKIPIIGEAKQNLNVPAPEQYDVAAAGAVNRAQAQVAGQVANYGVGLLEKRKKAADNDYAFKTYVDDYQAIEQESNRLKTEMPENADGYATGMKKFLDDRRTKNEANATSEEGLRLYRDKSMSLFKGAEVEAQNFENTSRAKYYVKSLDENANKLASTFLSNPDYTRAKEAQAVLETEIEENSQTHFVDVGTREKLKQQVRDSVAISVHDGLGAQERYGEQMRLLKNTDPKTDIFLGMDAAKRGSLLKQAAAGIETQRRQNDSELRGRIADVMDSQMKGEEVNENVLMDLSKRIQVSGLRPDEKERYGDSLAVSGIVASEKKRLLELPYSEWKDPEEVIPNRPDGQNARIVNKAQAALAREMSQMRKEMMNDPATYAMKSSPALMAESSRIQVGNPADTQGFNAKMLSRQEVLGVPKPRILSVQMAQQVGQNFINQSPSDAATSALALKAAHGKYAPKVFAEIAKDAKLPADFMMVAYMQTPQASTTVIDNMKRGPEITKAFQEKHKIDDKTVMRRVSSKMETYSSALAQQGTSSLSLNNAINNQVAIEAKKRMVLGTDSDIGSAIDNSIESLVKTNFVPVKQSRSNFIMPRFDGNGRPLNEETVGGFVRAYSKRQGFEALGVAVPDTFAARLSGTTQTFSTGLVGGSIDRKQQDVKDRYYKQLESDGYWVPTSDNSGIMLTTKIDGVPTAVLDGKGQPIRRTFHDLSNEQDDLTLAETTPVWKRMFKSNKAQAGTK